MMGYCVKCKMKRQMKNEKKTLVKGRTAMVANCPKCNTKMYKFISNA